MGGMTTQEAIAYARLKSFCSNIIKRLAPPLLREVQAANTCPEPELRTPRRSRRVAKHPVEEGTSKAAPAENVLLRALGLSAQDLSADEESVQELKDLLDSPLREQHVRVIAAIFG